MNFCVLRHLNAQTSGLKLTCPRAIDTSWLGLKSDGQETGGGGFKNNTRLLVRIWYSMTKYAREKTLIRNNTLANGQQNVYCHAVDGFPRLCGQSSRSWMGHCPITACNKLIESGNGRGALWYVYAGSVPPVEPYPRWCIFCLNWQLVVRVRNLF